MAVSSIIKQRQQNKIGTKTQVGVMSRQRDLHFFHYQILLQLTPYKTKAELHRYRRPQQKAVARLGSEHTNEIIPYKIKCKRCREVSCFYCCTFETNGPFISDERFSPNRGQEMLELMHFLHLIANSMSLLIDDRDMQEVPPS